MYACVCECHACRCAVTHLKQLRLGPEDLHHHGVRAVVTHEPQRYVATLCGPGHDCSSLPHVRAADRQRHGCPHPVVLLRLLVLCSRSVLRESRSIGSEGGDGVSGGRGASTK